MFATILYLIFLSLSSPSIMVTAAALVSTSSPSMIITSPAVLPFQAKRDLPPQDIGSINVSAYWTTWYCPLGSTWTTLSHYARCATTGTVEAPMWTQCTNKSVMVGPFDTSTCTGTGLQTTCVTGTIHYDHDSTLMNYQCWPSWTLGNWEAWHLVKEGPSLAEIIPPAVVIPVVAILVGWFLLSLRLRRRRRARMNAMIGEVPPDSRSSHSTPYATISPHPKEMESLRPAKELEEQRRLSELSSTRAPLGSIAGTLASEGPLSPVSPIATHQNDRDDASSYHTTNSRIVQHELDAADPPRTENSSQSEENHNRTRGFFLYPFRR